MVLSHASGRTALVQGSAGYVAGALRGHRADVAYLGDDLDVTMRVFAGLSEEQGIALHLPTAWRREDPWAALR